MCGVLVPRWLQRAGRHFEIQFHSVRGEISKSHRGCCCVRPRGHLINYGLHFVTSRQCIEVVSKWFALGALVTILGKTCVYGCFLGEEGLGNMIMAQKGALSLDDRFGAILDSCFKKEWFTLIQFSRNLDTIDIFPIDGLVKTDKLETSFCPSSQ